MDIPKLVIALIVMVLFGTVSTTRTTCPSDHVSRNGICCQFVRCGRQHYVKVCEKNGEPDVCHPCPASTYLDDPTDSNFVFDCIEKNCGEDTIPSDYPATRFDSTACAKRCRCNTAINYCGTDPCKCRQHTCFPGEVLQETCTCVRYEARVTSTTNSAILPITSTSKDGQSSQSTPNQSAGQSTPSGITADSRSEVTESEKDIEEPKVEDSDNDSEEKNSSDSPIIITTLVIISLGFVLGGVGGVFVVYKWKGRNSHVIYSEVNVHNNNNTVNNYENCNVQIGNKNNMDVCNNVTEHDSDSAE